MPKIIAALPSITKVTSPKISPKLLMRIAGSISIPIDAKNRLANVSRNGKILANAWSA